GSLVGAIPPIIGWTAAGADLIHLQIFMIAFFFFIWQIPHFWLLLLVLDDDYKKAGIPTLTNLFSKESVSPNNFYLDNGYGYQQFILANGCFS
ncbi:MAG: UbiA family prenyltransferase, partial [Ignavibacterium sp.]|uniref:UbiA family prenyltransferase n=1 Tax=Ignavibacterium sp. TaxID=2651167 RepID=UPI00404A8059